MPSFRRPHHIRAYEISHNRREFPYFVQIFKARKSTHEEPISTKELFQIERRVGYYWFKTYEALLGFVKGLKDMTSWEYYVVAPQGWVWQGVQTWVDGARVVFRKESESNQLVVIEVWSPLFQLHGKEVLQAVRKARRQLR